MLNSVIVQGKITSELKPKVIDNGRTLLLFTIVHTRDLPDSNGERAVDYIDIVAWDGLANFIKGNFGVGDEVIIDGRLQVRSFKTDGKSRVKLMEVIAENAYFGRVKN